MTDFRNAQTGGLLSTCPSFSTAFRCMEDPGMTPVLKSLIEQSALPLKAVETDFAADASGLSTSVYDRWYDHKWGKEKKQARFLKAHTMCGVNTKIVTAVEITEANVHDSPPFPGLVAKTAENFTMSEVSADKAYLSRKNLRAIVDAGATPTYPSRSTPGRSTLTAIPCGPRRTTTSACIGRSSWTITQALQRGNSLLDDKGQVRRLPAIQEPGGPGERSLGQDSVP